MNQFLSLAAKEFRQIFRDRRTLLILLGMPLMLVLLLGYAIKTELNNAQVAAFIPTKDAETQRIVERFRASKYFTMTEELSEAEQINTVFREGNASLVLVFSEHFARNLLHGISFYDIPWMWLMQHNGAFVSIAINNS